MSILDNAKEVANAVHEIKNLELYERVVNLHSDIVGLVEENIRLRNENRELKEALDLKGKMTFEEPFWYLEGDETPYCPACWEVKKQAVHVVVELKAPTSSGRPGWQCPNCKHVYDN